VKAGVGGEKVYFMVDETDACSMCLMSYNMYFTSCSAVVLLFVVIVLFL